MSDITEEEHIYKSHNKSLLLYHLVFPAKYRRKIFTNSVEKSLKEVCIGISERYEVRFVEIGVYYAGSVNVFIVEFKNDKKRVMIDAGFGARRGKLLTEMKKTDITPESISDILITHIHPDHVGGLPDFPKAKIHIAQEEYEAWAKDPSRKYLAKYLPEKENLSLFAYCTEVVPDLKAIKAAGHTPGHTVFQMKDRYFVGDIVHAVDLQIAHPFFSSRYDINPQEAAASRRKLKEFRGEWFGAHITYPGKYRNP